MKSTPQVGDYMSTDVTVVAADETVRTVAEKILSNGNDGFPVCSEGNLVGYVEPHNLLLKPQDDEVSKVMQTDMTVATTGMRTSAIARLMFRQGQDEIPITDESNHFVGVITNTDVVRSQIERSTPNKVKKISNMLREIYNATPNIVGRKVEISNLLPTQDEVFQDELNGRQYEIENGLAEPIVVIKSGTQYVLTDGHHRATAANKSGVDSLYASVIVVDDSIELGMVETARKQGLSTIDDVDINETGQHPIFEKTGNISDIK